MNLYLVKGIAHFQNGELYASKEYLSHAIYFEATPPSYGRWGSRLPHRHARTVLASFPAHGSSSARAVVNSTLCRTMRLIMTVTM
jgi:hypothetical protein